jgi:hypothetical protein
MTVDRKTDCQWDLVSLGEVMLRPNPRPERSLMTRSFRAWEGDGECTRLSDALTIEADTRVEMRMNA